MNKIIFEEFYDFLAETLFRRATSNLRRQIRYLVADNRSLKKENASLWKKLKEFYDKAQKLSSASDPYMFRFNNPYWEYQKVTNEEAGVLRWYNELPLHIQDTVREVWKKGGSDEKADRSGELQTPPKVCSQKKGGGMNKESGDLKASPHESTPSLAPKLLPCPFCGSPHVRMERGIPEYYHISCTGCGTHSGDFNGHGLSTKRLEELFQTINSVWNTRAARSEEKRCEGQSDEKHLIEEIKRIQSFVKDARNLVWKYHSHYMSDLRHEKLDEAGSRLDREIGSALMICLRNTERYNKQDLPSYEAYSVTPEAWSDKLRCEGESVERPKDLGNPPAESAVEPGSSFGQWLDGHEGDCTIYASLSNCCIADGICTCGYGRRLLRKGDPRQMYSKERFLARSPEVSYWRQRALEAEKKLKERDL